MRKEEHLVIHKARWVVPVSSPPISNGAVVTFGDRVVGVGNVHELQLQFHGAIDDHGDSILCPALVNAHSHLELSPLKHRLSPSGSFVSWVRSLTKARSDVDDDEWIPAIEKAVDEMIGMGIIAVGDTGNNGIMSRIATRSKGIFWPLRGVLFREIIKPNSDEADISEEISISENMDFTLAYSAHSLFSVAPDMIKKIKAWDRSKGVPFSIHVAESHEEMEFLRDGTGPIRKFLEERGRFPLGYDIPRTSPVKYLHNLGVLDEDTICVHSVHLDTEDMEMIARSRATVCLCPRSNVFLSVGVAPAEKLNRMGVRLAIGTDSLASNDMLSIFAEMSSLTKFSPGLTPEAIFKAATMGGARALGFSKEKISRKGKEGFLGSLEPGSSATFIAVKADKIRDEMEVFEYLVNVGSVPDFECYWVVPIP